MYRFAIPGLTLAAVLGLAACQQPQPAQQAGQPATGYMNDQARMQTPLPQGNIATTTTSRPATGSMNNQAQPPQPSTQNTVSRTTTGRNATGSMGDAAAFPAPQQTGVYSNQNTSAPTTPDNGSMSFPTGVRRQ